MSLFCGILLSRTFIVSTSWEAAEVPTARSSEVSKEGIPGVRFATDARQGTEAEERLLEIQVELANEAGLPPQHNLTLHNAEGLDGANLVYVSLWVPIEQESNARTKLETAGFDID